MLWETKRQPSYKYVARKRQRGEKKISALENIARIAKETTLIYGYHIPIVFAMGSEGRGIVHFESVGDTHDERARMMFMAGLEIAGNVGLHRGHQIGRILYQNFGEFWPGEMIRLHPCLGLGGRNGSNQS